MEAYDRTNQDEQQDDDYEEEPEVLSDDEGRKRKATAPPAVEEREVLSEDEGFKRKAKAIATSKSHSKSNGQSRPPKKRKIVRWPSKEKLSSLMDVRAVDSSIMASSKPRKMGNASWGAPPSDAKPAPTAFAMVPKLGSKSNIFLKAAASSSFAVIPKPAANASSIESETIQDLKTKSHSLESQHTTLNKEHERLEELVKQAKACLLRSSARKPAAAAGDSIISSSTTPRPLTVDTFQAIDSAKESISSSNANTVSPTAAPHKPTGAPSISEYSFIINRSTPGKAA